MEHQGLAETVGLSADQRHVLKRLALQPLAERRGLEVNVLACLLAKQTCGEETDKDSAPDTNGHEPFGTHWTKFRSRATEYSGNDLS